MLQQHPQQQQPQVTIPSCTSNIRALRSARNYPSNRTHSYCVSTSLTIIYRCGRCAYLVIYVYCNDDNADADDGDDGDDADDADVDHSAVAVVPLVVVMPVPRVTTTAMTPGPWE